MNNRTWFGRGNLPLPRRALALGLMALTLTACDVEEILDVTDPDIVDPTRLADSTALPAIRASVIGDFSEAYIGFGGTQEGQILTSGLLGDEWFHSGTFPTRSEIDIRKIQVNNGTLQTTTRNLYRARTSAEAAIRNYEQFSPNAAGFAEVLNLAGFTYIYFGENYCSGVPFSDLGADGSFTFGGQLPRDSVFNRALDRANRAITVAMAADNTTQLNLARLLKGRALVDLGRYQEAAAAVAEVPTSFSYQLLTSENTTREQNAVYVLNTISERWSVPNTEGGNGLPYRTADDPRVTWRRVPANDVGFDRTTPQYDQLKYPSRTAAVPVANGSEARLIEAEAALAAGSAEMFLSLLNQARTQDGAPELTAADIPSGMAERVDLLFRERAFALWLTSHRLGDMRRLIRQYGRPADQVFPVGEYHKNVQGGVYGNDVNLPISIDERNNPEFSQFPSGQDLCLDREA